MSAEASSIQNFFLNPDGETYKLFLQYDALATLARVMASLEMPTEEDYAHYDKLVDKASREDANPLFQAYLDNWRCNSRLAILFLMGYSSQFAEYTKPENEGVSKDFFFFLDEIWRERDHPQTALLQSVQKVIEQMSNFARDEQPPAESFLRLASRFEAISVTCQKAGKWEVALACMCSGMNFATTKDAELALDLNRQAAAIAQHTNEKDLIGYFVQNAILTCQLAQHQPDKKLMAFDAMERLIQYLLLRLQVRGLMPDGDILEKIKILLRDNDYLLALSPRFFYGFDLLPNDPVRESMRPLYATISSDPLPDWSAFMYKGTGHLIMEIENQRLSLLPHENTAETLWNDWTIRYKTMINAIPHNQSILKEEGADNILMDLKHELTHVYSLFGAVGTTLNIMRWLLIDLELSLLVNHRDAKNLDKNLVAELLDDLIHSRKPEPLDLPDIISLSYVERSVAIEAKIKFIEHIWTPWFEGIAIFGELADDPTLDAGIESLPSTVLKNLIDFILASDDENKNLVDFKAHFLLIEARYAEALQNGNNGIFKLRAYLTTYRRKYLPGYLCVRSIIATWRKTLGDVHLRGDQAFLLLLHVTRFSGYEMLPDLGLEIEQFKNAAMEKHLEWLKQLAAIPAGDITTFIGLDPKASMGLLGWEKGRLRIYQEGENTMKKEEAERVSKAKECYASLTGEDAPVDRIPGASDEMEIILGIAAETIGSQMNKPGILMRDSAGYLLSRYTILPLAETEAPFWLLEEGFRISCLIRTREKSSDNGKPSYNLLSFNIGEEDYNYIKTTLVRTGNARVKVRRVVILGGEMDGASLSGRHFYVYQYEKWIFVLNAGMFTNTETSDQITGYMKHRFGDNPGIDYREALNSPRHPAATRTRDWILANDWTQIDAGPIVNLKPWADYILGLCNGVLDNSPADIDRMNLGLLTFAFGDEALARRLMDEGFGALAQSAPGKMQSLMALLFHSMKNPVEPGPKEDDLYEWIRELYGPLLEKTAAGYDLTSISNQP